MILYEVYAGGGLREPGGGAEVLTATKNNRVSA